MVLVRVIVLKLDVFHICVIALYCCGCFVVYIECYFYGKVYILVLRTRLIPCLPVTLSVYAYILGKYSY